MLINTIMKKIFQTIHKQGQGNCLPAVIATLLELPLKSVPHFNRTTNWYQSLLDFLFENGYGIVANLYNRQDAFIQGTESYLDWYAKNEVQQLDSLKEYKGLNELFYATVYSPKYWTKTRQALHAVIIDKNFNIIHDPEKAYSTIKKYPKADILGFNGIMEVCIIEKFQTA